MATYALTKQGDIGLIYSYENKGDYYLWFPRDDEEFSDWDSELHVTEKIPYNNIEQTDTNLEVLKLKQRDILKEYLPCVECNKANLSCCATPNVMWPFQNAWNLLERLKKKNDPLGSELQIYKIDGVSNRDFMIVTILPKKNVVENNALTYCCFFDRENSKCKVYKYRPPMCSEYGGGLLKCTFLGLSDRSFKEKVKKYGRLALNKDQALANRGIDMNRAEKVLYPYANDKSLNTKKWKKMFDKLKTIDFIADVGCR